MKKKKTGILTKLKRLFLKVLLMAVLFTLAQVLTLKYINPPLTPNVAWEWAEAIYEKKPEKKPVYIWKDLEDISPHLRRAVVAAEDQRFLLHKGFDLNEIKAALKGMINEKKLRGASTISMQTARSVFWLSSRSVIRKVAEVYYTVLIEVFWDKKRILEMYLNTVDWGTGVTGAQAASLKYFSRDVEKLTPSQAALMTAVLPNPHKWSVKKPTPYLKKRQFQIMRSMKKMPLL